MRFYAFYACKYTNILKLTIINHKKNIYLYITDVSQLKMKLIIRG
jgi:hypothetical protein